MVDGEVELLEDGGELELRGRDLVVARLGGDAEAPELALDLLHELQDARADRAEVVVLELLVAGRRGAEERAAGLDEVGALEVELSVDEEVLLLGAERDAHRLLGEAEAAHEARRRLLERLDGAQERRLAVERLAAVGAERGGDAERGAVGVALDERGRGGVPRGVAARLERGADAAVREGRGVGLAEDEVLAGEGEDGLAAGGGLEEGVVLLGGAAVERHEPVREVRGAAVDGPFLHAVGDVGRDGGVERDAAVDGGEELLRDGLRKVLADGALAEDVAAEVVDRGAFGGGGRFGRARGDGVERVGAVGAGHGVAGCCGTGRESSRNAPGWKERRPRPGRGAAAGAGEGRPYAALALPRTARRTKSVASIRTTAIGSATCQPPTNGATR